MQPAIHVENLGKSYRLQHAAGPRDNYKTLRESLTGLVTAPVRRLRSVYNTQHTEFNTGLDEFWALKEVSFDVQQGEVVGIIGRNGAGKSTLLKILSRITKPTTGLARIRGRVGSLLEVGTGFHPELTGRENVYLSGSILGMTRRDINQRFSDIVQFAEVERFLDTPVKRYSSGMYVRLAFAVAAHMEPEILIVDEVLSVGDAGFQQKCFEKMKQIRSSGRTVLVVSHNLGAILSICTSAINMESGRIQNQGVAEEQVAWYLRQLAQQSKVSLDQRVDREGDQMVMVRSIDFCDHSGKPVTQAISGQVLAIRVRCKAMLAAATVDYAALSCWTADGVRIFHVDNLMRGSNINISCTEPTFTCTIPNLPLPPGAYSWNVMISGAMKVHDHVYAAASLEVLPGDFYKTGHVTRAESGMIFIDHDWSVQEEASV